MIANVPDPGTRPPDRQRRRLLGRLAATASLPLLPRRSPARMPLSMQAAWINDAEFSGYYVAMDEAWYAEEGLDLHYLPGGPDVVPEHSLISGLADLALTSPDTTVKAIVEERAPFRIIAAQYQKNPLGIVSLASNPIDSIEALVGKTLAVPPVNVVSVEAVLVLNGIDPATVKIVPYGYDPSPLLAGEIDASLDFVTNVPYTIGLRGGTPVSLLLYDAGYTIFNDTVVVTERTLATRRAELVAWLRASRRGWKENFADTAVWPPKWADTWFADNGRGIDNEIYFNAAQRPLMMADGGLFSMSEASIAANIEALGRVGLRATRAMFDTSLLEEL